MSAKVPCPRCGQDWLHHVELVKLDKRAILCPECEALWLDGSELGTTWVDYGTFMRQAGRLSPNEPSELRVLEAIEH
jgi:Zn-finger nucleic acid-binding protein